MLKKWVKLSLLWLGLIALVLFHYVTGITPLILNAETYDSYVDYAYYNVANFDNYTPILSSNTTGLDYYIRVKGSFDYEVEYCPLDGYVASIGITNRIWDMTQAQQLFNYSSTTTPLNCLQPYETYTFDIELPLNEVIMNYGASFTDAILDFDDIYYKIFTFISFSSRPQMVGYDINMTNILIQTWLEIRFNTNYLMSTFLLESDQVDQVVYANDVNRPFILYAENNNDLYNVYNDNLSTTFLNRTKYAIEIPDLDAAIVVNKIGTGWESFIPSLTLTMSSTAQFVWQYYHFHTLNAAPMPTPFDDVAIDTTPNYSVCDNVLGFPIDCTLDGVPIGSFQAMANDLWEWTIKESPIFSDVWTLASGGFQWLSNTFQFLGYFDVDSLLGGILALLIGVIVMLWAWVGG